MSTAAPPPVSSKPAPSANASQGSPAETLIQERVESARRAIWWSEITRVVLKVVIGVMGALLAWLVMDHWIYSPPAAVRLICFVALVAFTGWYLIRRTLPVLRADVTPDYAAWALEQDHPDYRQQLTSYVTLKDGDPNGGIRARVVRVIGARAASLLKTHDPVPAETMGTFRWWMLAAAMFAILLGYCVTASKSSVASVKRLFVPLADIAPALRVEIRDVQPGHADALAGRSVMVSAEVDGIDDDEIVVCRWAGEGPSEEFELTLDEQTRRHSGMLTLPHSASGIVSYSIHAGDAMAGPYHLQVENVPVVAVRSIFYEPPAYTRQKAYTASSPSVSTIDGALVRINAQANRPVARAELQFNPKSVGGTVRATGGQRAVTVAEDGTTLTVEFVARSAREQRTSVPMESYRILVWDSNEQSNPDPIVYPVKVIPDLPPEVSIVVPSKSPVEVPENGQQIIEVHAMDADFELQEVSLEIRRGVDTVAEPLIWLRPKGTSGRGNQVAVYRFRPQEHRLLAGDVVRVAAIALDNREVEGNDSIRPNLSRTDPLEIRVIEDDEELPEDPVGNDGLSKPDDQPASEASEQGGEGDQGGGQGGEGESGEGESGEGESGEGESGEGESGEGESGEGESGEGGTDDRGSDGTGTETGDSGSGGSETGEGASSDPSGGEDQGGTDQGGTDQGGTDQGGTDPESGEGGSESSGGSDSMNSEGETGSSSESADTDSQGGTGGESESETGSEASGEKGGEGGQQEGAGQQDAETNAERGAESGGGSSSDTDSPSGQGNQGTENQGAENQGTENQGTGQNPESAGGREGTGDNSGEGMSSDSRDPSAGEPQAEGTRGSEGGESTGTEGTSGQSSGDSQGQSASSSDGDPGEGSEPSGPPEHDGDAFERIKDYIEKKQQEQSGGESSESGDPRSESGESGENTEGDGAEGQGDPDAQADDASATDQREGSPQDNSDGASGETGEAAQPKKAGDSGEQGSSDPKGAESEQGSPSSEGEGSAKDGADSNQGNQPPTGAPNSSDSNSGGEGEASGQNENAAAENADPPPPPDLEYAKQATDMVLDYLKETRDAVDEDLLKELDWTAEDLERFRSRWEQAREINQLQPDLESSGDFAEALGSLGLQKDGGPRSNTARRADEVRNLRDGGNRRQAPPSIRDAFEAFRRRQ